MQGTRYTGATAVDDMADAARRLWVIADQLEKVGQMLAMSSDYLEDAIEAERPIPGDTDD